MRSSMVVGIDVGTRTTRVVIADNSDANMSPHVIGIGKAASRGLRHGYVTNQQEASASIRSAVAQAEASSKTKIKRAYVSIGGVGLSSEIITTSIIISKADGEITPLEIEKIAEKAEGILLNETKNKKVIHSIPLQYLLDGKEVLGRPIGLHGVKLEIKMLFITTLEHHFDDIIGAVTDAGVDIIDVIASPIASSMAALSQRQKVVGSLLIDIGAETVSIGIFENDSIISLQVFPIGSSDITNDIALGFQVDLDEAEHFKRNGGGSDKAAKKKLEEIVEARLSDIFELIEIHLKRIKRSGLLPAGAIIIGGGALLPTIEDFARKSLRLPTQVMRGEHVQQITQRKLSDPSWFIAYGLCFLDGVRTSSYQSNVFVKSLRSIKQRFGSIFEQFLP